MKVKLVRFHHGKDDTLGLLFIDGVFQCFTLEDEYREAKVAGETRIPEGTYLLGLRNFGKHAERYGHPMIEIKNVPGFTDILIHKGNTEKDTAGCLLVGMGCGLNFAGSAYLVESTRAYDMIYPVLAERIPKEPVPIEITFLPIT